MWFQFAPDKNGRSQLFYGFPAVPWGPPNSTRIAVDAATSRIKDPSARRTNVVNPEDIRDTQDFIKEHLVGVDSTVPAFTGSCLQTNVFGALSLVFPDPDVTIAHTIRRRQHVRSGLCSTRVSSWRAQIQRHVIYGRMGDEIRTVARKGTSRDGSSGQF